MTADQGLLFGVAGRFIHVFDLGTGTYSGAADVLRPITDPLGGMAGRFNRVVMHPNGAEFYAGPIEFSATTVLRSAPSTFSRSRKPKR